MLKIADPVDTGGEGRQKAESRLSTFQCATLSYAFALLPSIHTLRRHLPAESGLQVSLITGRKESVPPRVLRYLRELRVEVETVAHADARVTREAVLAESNRQFLRLL